MEGLLSTDKKFLKDGRFWICTASTRILMTLKLVLSSFTSSEQTEHRLQCHPITAAALLSSPSCPSLWRVHQKDSMGIMKTKENSKLCIGSRSTRTSLMKVKEE